MTNAIYQAVCSKYAEQKKLKVFSETQLNFHKPDTHAVSFKQILNTWVEIYNKLSGLNLPNTIVNGKGQNKNDEVFVMGNEEGQGLYFDIMDIKSADAETGDPADYTYYRCATVGLQGLVLQACVAWLDDYTFKVYDALNHITVAIWSLNPKADISACQEVLSSCFQKIGYTL